ncbi:MAG: DNA translocase FtsK 4TM domain-containing protein [Bacilli bacterium]|nr:DNA translocase FtsK 4TM domain-containing protein [Bacilli bacterium]
MAKKKKRKETKKDISYLIELKGMLLILIAIIGICKFGPVGTFIGSFAGFFVGVAYNILLVTLFIIGIYMIIKRDYPIFFSSKLIGLYSIVIALLVFCHLSYIKQLDVETIAIFKETIDNLMAFTQTNSPLQGGGMIGALFSFAFVSLFTIEGTRVICVALIIFGIVMFTGMSLYDMLKASKNKVSSALKKAERHHKKEEKVKIEMPNGINDEEIEDTKEIPKEEHSKLVISSFDELKQPEEKQINEEVEVLEKDEIEIIAPDDDYEEKEYIYPSIDLLNKPKKKNLSVNKSKINETADILKNVFHDFNIEGKVVTAHVGPAVTQYEMEIKAGTKLSKILGIHREIALALAAKDVRIQAPIPGKKTVGIEIPNAKTAMVSVREILETIKPEDNDKKLLVALGQDIMGNAVTWQINKTPHLLVAGSTGSGKSVCINSLIISMLMRSKPDEVKLVLVDPKKVELSMYNGVPHLLAPVVTDARKANIALKKIVVEMERRYDLFEASGTKNIEGYNKLVEKKQEEGEDYKKLPFIVVIIDELADLMLVAAKEVEDSIMRITQMARAAGIHLIVATQRPSTDVITGVVKANIPSRIAFAVSSSIDSRTILDMVGAEKLLGKGDMLFLPQGENIPIRVQGTFISDEEIKAVVDYVISQQKARYDNTLLMDDEEMNAKSSFDGEEHDANEEPLYNEIVEFVVTQGKASASLLQRRFRLGYNRAARCIDLLEERGIIGPSNGSKPREVLVKLENNE